jgi:hypothetical protein
MRRKTDRSEVDLRSWRRSWREGQHAHTRFGFTSYKFEGDSWLDHYQHALWSHSQWPLDYGKITASWSWYPDPPGAPALRSAFPPMLGHYVSMTRHWIWKHLWRRPGPCQSPIVWRDSFAVRKTSRVETTYPNLTDANAARQCSQHVFCSGFCWCLAITWVWHSFALHSNLQKLAAANSFNGVRHFYDSLSMNPRPRKALSHSSPATSNRRHTTTKFMIRGIWSSPAIFGFKIKSYAWGLSPA